MDKNNNNGMGCRTQLEDLTSKQCRRRGHPGLSGSRKRRDEDMPAAPLLASIELNLFMKKAGKNLRLGGGV